MMTRMIRYELRDLNQRTFFVQMPAQTASPTNHRRTCGRYR